MQLSDSRVVEFLYIFVFDIKQLLLIRCDCIELDSELPIKF